MFAVPEKIEGISHPMVDNIYLKRDFDSFHEGFDVLVIEATCPYKKRGAHEQRMLVESLMQDLSEIQIQAQEKIGHFDRVDIRLH